MRSDQITPREVDRLSVDILPTIMQDTVEPQMRALIADFGQQQLSEIGFAGAFRIVDARVVGFLAELSSQRVVGINATTRRQLAAQLAEGVLEGEGIGPLSQRVQRVFNAARVRALAIARTEVNAAANFARHEAMIQSELVEKKRWLATRDTRTRHNHRKLHDQVRELREPFRVPGTSMVAQRPGGFTRASENVNCRCVIVPVLDRVVVDDEHGELLVAESDRDTIESFDQMVRRWEVRIAAVFTDAFDEQERRVMADLRAADRD